MQKKRSDPPLLSLSSDLWLRLGQDPLLAPGVGLTPACSTHVEAMQATTTSMELVQQPADRQLLSTLIGVLSLGPNITSASNVVMYRGSTSDPQVSGAATEPPSAVGSNNPKLLQESNDSSQNIPGPSVVVSKKRAPAHGGTRVLSQVT